MSLRSVAAAVIAVLGAPALAASAPPQEEPARKLVRSAADAMGGEAALRAVRGVHLTSVGHWSLVEGSERPEPPWDIDYEESEEWLDYDHGAWRNSARVLATAFGETPEWQTFEVIVSDGAAALRFGTGKELKPGSKVHVGDAVERLAIQPDRIVLAALDARDLRIEHAAVLHGQPQQVVSFHAGGWPYRLWIDERTKLPTAAELILSLPEDYFWNIWGDVRDQLEFQQWSALPGGIRYPRQVNLVRNGIPYHSFSSKTVELGLPSADHFQIPDPIRQAYQASARGPESVPAAGEGPVVEVAPGVLFAPARKNALLVAQESGMVFVDAPISSGYFAREIDEAARRYHRSGKAVVLTSHVIPQLSGLRTAAAKGMPLYFVDANRPFVQALLSAPHTLTPDVHAPAVHAPKLVGVAQRTTLGSGANRLELIPMHTARGERTMLVWFPEHRLLWVSGALQLDEAGKPSSPTSAVELAEAVEREHLDVANAIGSQLPLTPWSKVQQAVGTGAAARTQR